MSNNTKQFQIVGVSTRIPWAIQEGKDKEDACARYAERVENEDEEWVPAYLFDAYPLGEADPVKPGEDP